ncbi:uncharacterized protein PFL1_03674 [Pseudozyma flocculosa PF-1]|uniref:Uncharacterized protein n=2 Tax=Pseudozyma flocculosa TaxID=84751 RepID=A0A5C3F5S7_9BASI|nr:uncharacterized protein PFL1_03674 [Pseudozyma flocculosa PF-1]EPQ28872.1 hypothetical protein PFL1_03674 [Pseudozyma flocculosa PF-1]SPO39336.1 uncharacterized protein PSFLO_04817 [Pseudozyma flocculosa]
MAVLSCFAPTSAAGPLRCTHGTSVEKDLVDLLGLGHLIVGVTLIVAMLLRRRSLAGWIGLRTPALLAAFGISCAAIRLADKLVRSPSADGQPGVSVAIAIAAASIVPCGCLLLALVGLSRHCREDARRLHVVLHRLVLSLAPLVFFLHFLTTMLGAKYGSAPTKPGAPPPLFDLDTIRAFFWVLCGLTSLLMVLIFAIVVSRASSSSDNRSTKDDQSSVANLTQDEAARPTDATLNSRLSVCVAVATSAFTLQWVLATSAPSSSAALILVAALAGWFGYVLLCLPFCLVGSSLRATRALPVSRADVVSLWGGPPRPSTVWEDKMPPWQPQTTPPSASAECASPTEGDKGHRPSSSLIWSADHSTAHLFQSGHQRVLSDERAEGTLSPSSFGGSPNLTNGRFEWGLASTEPRHRRSLSRAHYTFDSFGHQGALSHGGGALGATYGLERGDSLTAMPPLVNTRRGRRKDAPAHLQTPADVAQLRPSTSKSIGAMSQFSFKGGLTPIARQFPVPCQRRPSTGKSYATSSGSRLGTADSTASTHTFGGLDTTMAADGFGPVSRPLRVARTTSSARPNTASMAIVDFWVESGRTLPPNRLDRPDDSGEEVLRPDTDQPGTDTPGAGTKRPRTPASAYGHGRAVQRRPPRTAPERRKGSEDAALHHGLGLYQHGREGSKGDASATNDVLTRPLSPLPAYVQKKLHARRPRTADPAMVDVGRSHRRFDGTSSASDHGTDSRATHASSQLSVSISVSSHRRPSSPSSSDGGHRGYDYF